MENYTKQFHIRYITLKLTIQFLQDCTIFAEKVSAIRGLLGNRLLHNYCIYSQNPGNCEQCTFPQACIVQRIMYAPLKIPLPFVTTGNSEGYIISCKNKKTKFVDGEVLSFSITLFGDVIIYSMPILQAFLQSDAYGLGKEQAKFKVVRMEDSSGRNIFINNKISLEHSYFETLDEYITKRIQGLSLQENDSCIVTFYSPLSLKYQGTILEEFHIGAFLNGLSRRVYIMNCFEGRENAYWRKWHDGTFWGSFSKEQKNLIEKKPTENKPIGNKSIENKKSETEYLPVLEVKSQNKTEVKRYSTNQQKKMLLCGIEGEFSLHGITGEMLWYLLAGEILHVGKYTSFGFGGYSIEKIETELL